MVDTYEQHSKTKLIGLVVAIIVIAGIVVLADQLRSKTNDTNASTTNSVTTPSTPAATSTDSSSVSTNQTSTSNSTTSSSNSYKDGTYSASSSYSVPHGQESIQVSLTLKDGAVSDVSVQNSEGDRDSAEYQQAFTESYKSQVVGKKISSLQLSTIAGASDTTQGFNDAISQIASKAAA